MSKEIVPLHTEDLVVSETLSIQEPYVPAISEKQYTKISSYMEAEDKPTLIKYASGLAGSSLSSMGVTFSLMPLYPSPTMAVVLIVAEMFAIAGATIATMSLITKKRKKKYNPVKNYIENYNFDNFVYWAETKYNIKLDMNALTNEARDHLVLILCGVEKVTLDTYVQDTNGNKYFLRNKGKGISLVEELNLNSRTITLTQVPSIADTNDARSIEDTSSLFSGENISIWKALQKRLATIDSYGLSVENAHAVNRIKQDCQELLTTLYKLKTLNTEPDSEDLVTVLNNLNEEVQNIINEEAAKLKNGMKNQAGWVASRKNKQNVLQLSPDVNYILDENIPDNIEKQPANNNCLNEKYAHLVQNP